MVSTGWREADALTCCWFSLCECRRAWMHSLVSWKACLWEPSAG